MKKVILHLGAHKTATTSLQGVLKKNRNYLCSKGIFYAPLGDLRKALTKPYFYPGQAANTDIPDFSKLLSEELNYEGQDKVFLSDESIISLVQEIFLANKFYSKARHRIKKLKQVLEGCEITDIFFTVRSYEKYITSLYGQVLKGVGFVEFETYKKRFDRHAFCWADVIVLLEEEFPDSKIHVGEFDFVVRNPQEYYSAMLFGEDYSMLKGKNSQLNSGISNEAYIAASWINENLKEKLSMEQMLSLVRHFPLNRGSKLSLFDEEESLDLKKKYEKDVAKIISNTSAVFYGEKGKYLK
ncbi:hypothetical protein ACJJIL_07415 [Microbulbifer sp. EKSA005]|uniref:hypothetical protein n=1 Tax=Microbulbifer sp. EKSA005 TaxID=3243364 RepID=UPI0040413652